MNSIYVVISMDCEPVRDAATVTPASSGPVSYEDSATFIRGYTQQAEQYGFPISFFVHPEVAVAHPELFLELEQEKGACLGLHSLAHAFAAR